MAACCCAITEKKRLSATLSALRLIDCLSTCCSSQPTARWRSCQCCNWQTVTPSSSGRPPAAQQSPSQPLSLLRRRYPRQKGRRFSQTIWPPARPCRLRKRRRRLIGKLPQAAPQPTVRRSLVRLTPALENLTEQLFHIAVPSRLSGSSTMPPLPAAPSLHRTDEEPDGVEGAAIHHLVRRWFKRVASRHSLPGA
jgi:hypothetical protein